MAATLTKLSATPSSLKYTYQSSGAGSDSVSKTAAQIIADCAAGPLKETLKQLNAGLNAGISGWTWATADSQSPISIYLLGKATSGTNVLFYFAVFASGANRFDTSASCDGAFTGQVEIRFHPTAVR